MKHLSILLWRYISDFIDDFIHVNTTHDQQLQEMAEYAINEYGFNKCNIDICNFANRHYRVDNGKKMDPHEKDSHINIYQDALDIQLI